MLQMKNISWTRLGIGLLAASLLSGCASMRQEPTAQIYDPYEPTNRKILSVNQAVLGPVARVVHAVTPGPLRDRLVSFDNNLKEPRIFGNDLLQFRPEAALKTATRFVINSTFGVGGLFDPAGGFGIPQQSGDFGETLFVWGVQDGPYLVLPLYGPSTTRDAVGLAVDSLADPVNWSLSAAFGDPATYGLAGLDLVSQIGQLKEAEDSSIDFYSFLRSSYYQTRRAQLREAIGLSAQVQSPAESPAAQPAPAPKRLKKRRPPNS
jgi:phospholipid-binding lipoprotein MlaA